MPKYRVRQGKRFGPGGRFTAGSILEMSEREAQPFADILEPAQDNALVGSTQAVVPHEDLNFENELEVEVPEDLKLMPGTLSAEDDFEGESANKPMPAEDEAAVEPKPTRKPSSKSTRKRSHEG